MLRQYGDFNVFQLMRLLLSDAANGMPAEQRLRFRADLSAAFPAREFTQLKLLPAHPANAGNSAAPASPDDDSGNTQVVEISTANFCIASVIGPLPESFTEWVRELASSRSTAMADFLDIFNQRANILRYQLKQTLTMQLHQVPPAQTEMAHCLASLMGLAQPQLARQLPLPARSWLGLAGLLANRRKPASTIVRLLSLALGTKVILTPCIGAWQNIEAQDRCLLGQRNQQLGRMSVLGRRVWDQQARLRLHIGEIDYATLCRLLPPPPAAPAAAAAVESPDSADFHLLSSLLKLLVDRLADCEIELSVKAASIPPVPLPQPARQQTTSAMRLGQSAWLASAATLHKGMRSVRYLIRTTDDGARRMA